MWLAEVKAKGKRRNQILFGVNNPLLVEVRWLVAGANRRALILWALELADVPPFCCTECSVYCVLRG